MFSYLTILKNKSQINLIKKPYFGRKNLFVKLVKLFSGLETRLDGELAKHDGSAGGWKRAKEKSENVEKRFEQRLEKFRRFDAQQQFRISTG